MDGWAIMETQAFQRIMFNMSLISLVFAVGVILVAFVYYGRGRDVYGKDEQAQFRTLLMGSWRDSLIITLLFTAESFAHDYAGFIGLAQVAGYSVTSMQPIIQPVLGSILHILIFTVTILRIILISRWLGGEKAKNGQG